MAKTGTIKGTCDNSNYTLTCSWSVISSTETTSTVTAKVYLKAPNGWSTYSDYWDCTINGTKVTDNKSTWVKGESVLLGQKTWIVTHDSNGNCSTNISFSYVNGLQPENMNQYTTHEGSGSGTAVINSISSGNTVTVFTTKKENIILYKENETNFTHNGIYILKPLECIITRNLVDYVYELDMKYPMDDTGYWKQILEGRIIKANGQLFRIVQTNISVVDFTIEVYAKHIFFDLQKNFIEEVNIQKKQGNVALTQLLDGTSYSHHFQSSSDSKETKSFKCSRKNVLDALLGDGEDSFVNLWGGELDMDNFNVKFVKQLGSNKGYKIKYGKNLTGLTLKTDHSTVVTQIKPVGFDGISLKNKEYITSSNVNKYCMPIIKEIKYEHVKWTGSPNYDKDDDDDDNSSVYSTLSLAQAELRRLASLEYSEKEIDLPSVTCEVNFVELANTEEYSSLKGLETISLGDIVNIEHQPLGINIKARCIGYTYDCLKSQYEELIIGHYQKNFFREASKATVKVNSGDLDIGEKLQDVYVQTINKMSDLMNSNMNGYVVMNKNEILIMDTDDKETAQKVWKFNSAGIAFSSNGYDGDYTVGLTMDGRINGSIITANSIQGGMLELETITSRELAIDIQETLSNAMTEETTQALITANLNKFESSLSHTFITEENAQQQIETATEKAVGEATKNVVDNAVQEAMDSVNDQLDGKLSDYTTNTLNPILQNAMDETLQDSKDYVVEVTGNYYTKDETNSIISQTRENIELGLSSTYETKENTSVKITEAIDGVTVGAINRVFGTAEEKTETFTGINNDDWEVYDISPDISDKDIIVSFEYDLNATFEDGSSLNFQPKYISTSNELTYPQKIEVVSSTSTQTIDVKNQHFSCVTKFYAIQQDCKFRFITNGITGTFTIRKAQIKVGNKITEWSVAPEDIEENANNYTIEQLKSYYTKEQTDSKINILKDEINLGVSSTYETTTNVTTKVNNAIINASDDATAKMKHAMDTSSKQLNDAVENAKDDATSKANKAKDEAIDHTNTIIVNYYTKEETNAQIDITKKSIESTVSEKYATKLDIENISLGGENLIINSNFNYGFTNWEGNTDSYSITQDNKLFFNHSEYISVKNKQVYTKPIDASNLIGKEITLSFDYYIVDKSLWASNINIGYIRFFDDETKTSQNNSLEYENLVFADDYKNNTWRRISATITVPENSKFIRVGAYVNQNGKIYWDNFQLEVGNIATEWKPCSEDYKLYADQTTTQISSELSDLSKIVSDNTGSDSITSATKKKLISEYNDAIAVYDKLNSMYSVLGDTSFNNLPTELTTAKNNLTSAISPLESSINEASESGLSEILNLFNIFYSFAEELTKAISNALAGMTKENKTQIEQLSSEIKFKITEITTIGDKVNELYTHFTFASDGMTIKSSQNATKTVKLDNDSLDFMDNNTVVAQVTDKQLYITDAEVKNQMRIGNILIKPSGVGGIMFIYE